MFEFMQKFIELPQAGISYFVDQKQSKGYEKNNKVLWQELRISNKLIQTMKVKTQKQSPAILTQIDHQLVKTIREKTTVANRNNVTRTMAYLAIYLKHPEIHWAFLAHLVSRNGGWNMTDLKGSILQPILPTESKQMFFSFLEDSNWLIFHDAYAQLLLYEECKKKNKNLFYLLPKLGVSSFMKPCWEIFLETKDSQFLTIALIINEQNYIDMRVIQHPLYKEKVLNNLLFSFQEVLQLTYVLFPYRINEKHFRLAGLTVSNFSDVKERIEIGKKLYVMLFGNHHLHEDVLTFAKQVSHSGSRHDYWPSLFSNNYMEKLTTITWNCNPKKTVVFSPTLAKAWPDVIHSSPEEIDWFTNDKTVYSYFSPTKQQPSFDITRQYCRDVQKMVVASIAFNTLNQ